MTGREAGAPPLPATAARAAPKRLTGKTCGARGGHGQRMGGREGLCAGWKGLERNEGVRAFTLRPAQPRAPDSWSRSQTPAVKARPLSTRLARGVLLSLFLSVCSRQRSPAPVRVRVSQAAAPPRCVAYSSRWGPQPVTWRQVGERLVEKAPREVEGQHLAKGGTAQPWSWSRLRLAAGRRRAPCPYGARRPSTCVTAPCPGESWRTATTPGEEA